MRTTMPLVLMLAGCVLDWTPPDEKDEADEVEDADDIMESADGIVDVLEADNDSAPDAQEDGYADAEAEADVLPPCSTAGCSEVCGWAGFGLGLCMTSGADCYCTEPTDCNGPFRGWSIPDRWVVYTIHVVAGSVCHVSTCDDFTGDTHLVISGGWNGENDNACGLGSELTTGTVDLDNPLSVFVECLSPTCSWNITVDCSLPCVEET